MLFEVKFNTTNQLIPIQFESVQTATELVGGEPYVGVLEVIPSPEEQTLYTKGKVLVDDVTIKPIPQKYGLVTYDQNKTITIT